MFDALKKAYRYISGGVWTKEPSEYHTKFMRWFSTQTQVFLYTIRIFGQNQMVVRSAGLTYFTLLAIVPLIAVLFGVMKGFGDEQTIDNRLQVWIEGIIPQGSSLSTTILAWAKNLIEGAKGGWIAGIGSVVFLGSVIRVFMNVEESFNYIWEVRRRRGLAREVSDYVTVLILGPVLWLTFSAASGQIEGALENLVRGTFLWPLLTFLKAVIPLVNAALILTLVYKMIPNTKVKFSAALNAGIVAGVVLVCVQYFYTHGQSAISRYNAIYAGFAAVPLLFIWLNVCWMIILFGAELSFGYQNVERYRFERQSENASYDYRRKIILLVMHRIASNFTTGREQMDSEGLAESMNIPVRLVRDALFELEQAGLLVSVEDEKSRLVRYYPAQDVTKMRIYDVIRAVETHGVGRLDLAEDDELRSVNRLFDRLIDERQHSANNVRLLEIE